MSDDNRSFVLDRTYQECHAVLADNGVSGNEGYLRGRIQSLIADRDRLREDLRVETERVQRITRRCDSWQGHTERFKEIVEEAEREVAAFDGKTLAQKIEVMRAKLERDCVEANDHISLLKKETERLAHNLNSQAEHCRHLEAERDAALSEVERLTEKLSITEQSREFQAEFAKLETARVKTLEAELASLRAAKGETDKHEPSAAQQVEELIGAFVDFTAKHGKDHAVSAMSRLHGAHIALSMMEVVPVKESSHAT